MSRPAELTGRPRFRVVAGVLRDPEGRILITGRRPGTHGEGYWEFPGGKLAEGEAPEAGLGRELAEELGIQVRAAEPLLVLEHDYPDRSVALEFWLVTDYAGAPAGLENQPLRWVPVGELGAARLLPADAPVVTALTARFGALAPGLR